MLKDVPLIIFSALASNVVVYKTHMNNIIVVKMLQNPESVLSFECKMLSQESAWLVPDSNTHEPDCF